MSKSPPEVLTPNEADAILRQPNRKAVSGLRNRAMLEVMLSAGLRVSEVVNLRPSQVRLGQARLEVRGSKRGKGRNIALRPSSVEILELWKEHRPSSDWFFSTTCERGGIAKGSPIGARLSTAYVRQMVTRYADRAGIERRVTPHLFRHTFASTMLATGFTIREVQVLLGHSDVSTTMVYTHVNDAVIAAKVAALP